MKKQLTVSQLNNYIKGVFEDELILSDINVVGEIFEFKIAGKNSYITLKEGNCLLYCVYFDSLMEYEAGQEISVAGSVKFYPKSGKVFFNANSIKLIGRGNILAALEEVKLKLKKEGVFNNRRNLPVLVEKIALLTSIEGSVLHDFLEVIKTLSYLSVTIFDIRVQGEGANKQIISTMSDINNGFLGEFDTIILARGGGSASDLSEFNNEELARVINKSKIPVISAIGHETDYTLSDFAADIRAGTPSIAAGLIVENNRLFFERFFSASRKTCNSVKEIYRKKLIELNNIADRGHARLYNKNRKAYKSIVLAALDIHLKTCKAFRQRSNRLKENSERQFKCLSTSVAVSETLINIYSAKINELNPKNILSKGYARIYKKNSIVKSAQELNSGDNIKICFSDGGALATIRSLKSNEEKDCEA